MGTSRPSSVISPQQNGRWKARPRVLRPLFFSLFHDPQQIAFRIAKPQQPEILIRQRRDNMRWANDFHVSLLQLRELAVNVGGTKINISAGARLACALA